MKGFALVSLLLAMVVAGCKGDGEDFEPAFVPKTVAFNGEVDPELAGTWISKDAVSTLVLEKDGALEIRTQVPTPSGKSTSSVKGKWLAEGDVLRFQYGTGTNQTTLEYEAKRNGNVLVTKPSGGRLETTYNRK